jgi:hypothetical protein
MLRLAGEHEFSPIVALRMGLNFFYGWPKEDFTFMLSYEGIPADISMSGSRWGIRGSIGGTVKFQRLKLEPFVNAGWQKLNLNGDGENIGLNGAIVNLWGMDKSREEWSIGGGFSIKFN